MKFMTIRDEAEIYRMVQSQPDISLPRDESSEELDRQLERFGCGNIVRYGNDIFRDTPTKKMRKIKLLAKWMDFCDNLKDFLVPIICTPLSILFGIIAFVAKLASYVSCLGLFAGGWLLYQSFYASSKLEPVWKTENFFEAIIYILLPFVVFLVSAMLSAIHDYFNLRAY